VGRKLRYLPDDNHLVDVSYQVVQRRFLLRPSLDLDAIITRSGSFPETSRNAHLRPDSSVEPLPVLLRPRSVEQFASFMRDVSSKIAQEPGRLHGWRKKL
jgi:hypothetical protein